MKFRSDFVTNSSSSSFISYLFSDGKEIVEIEFCSLGPVSCEYTDEYTRYEEKMKKNFDLYYFSLDSEKRRAISKDKHFEEFLERYEKDNVPPKKTEYLRDLYGVRTLNKLLTVKSFGEMTKLLQIDKERAFCVYSAYDGAKHIKFNSLKEMIDLYDEKNFKPEKFVFIDGATDMYSTPRKCDYQHKIYEHEDVDTTNSTQSVFDLKNKLLIVSPQIYSSDRDFYDHNGNELLTDENLATKRKVLYMWEMWRRNFFNEEMQLSKNDTRAYFEVIKDV